MVEGYVEQRDGGYFVAGTRISLDSIVHEFLNGAVPESIIDNFELLTLEQVYGAITFYLSNRTEIDAHLLKSQKEFEEARRNQPPLSPDLRERLERARRHLDKVA